MGLIVLISLCVIIRSVYCEYHVKTFHQLFDVYGDSTSDRARMVRETLDGGFIIVGSTDAILDTEDERVMTVVKFDQYGTIEWVREISGPLGMGGVGYSVLVTHDGYVVTGYVDGIGVNKDPVMLKLDHDGTLVFSRIVFDDSSEKHFYSIIQAKNGDLVVAGEISIPDDPFDNVFFIRFTSDGELVWARVLELGGYESVYGLMETNEGDFVMSGNTDMHSLFCNEILLVSFSGDGSGINWIRTFGSDDGHDVTFGMCPCDGGESVIVTATYDGTSGMDVVVSKHEVSSGNVIWETSFSRSGMMDILYECFHNSKDQEIIVSGSVTELSGGCAPIVINLNSSTGRLIWASKKEVSVGEVYFAYSITQLIVNKRKIAVSGMYSNHSEYMWFLSLLQQEDGTGCGGWEAWQNDQISWSNEVDVWTVLNDINTDFNFTNPGDSWIYMTIPPVINDVNNDSLIDSFSHFVCYVCDDNYFEKPGCLVTRCNGVFSDSVLPEACSGHGECIAHDVCVCEVEWEGFSCSSEILLDDGNENEESLLLIIIIMGSVFGCISLLVLLIASVLLLLSCLLVFLIITCSSFICCTTIIFLLNSIRSSNKNNLTPKEKFLLEECSVESGEEANLARLKINQNLFTIRLDEIKLIKILGQGGSNSTVYKAMFNGVDVAFKNFKTSGILCSDQGNFDEFEREVSILGSLSHPNTLRFYGAVLEPPRVGIVMEYCPKGDLSVFIQKYRIENSKKPYPLEEKIRMLKEIVQAMEFLHSRKIIHRDLKCENVLITDDEHCKVMDFGCSKLVERMSRRTTQNLFLVS